MFYFDFRLEHITYCINYYFIDIYLTYFQDWEKIDQLTVSMNPDECGQLLDCEPANSKS